MTKKPGHSTDPFDLVNGVTLMEMNLPPPRFIIEGLLTPGLTILSGLPKAGKSMLLLWLSYRISKGLPVWNMPTTQGATLYLCLEDTLGRIQDRLKSIADEPSEHAYYTTQAHPLGQGLEEQIRDHMQKYPRTILIVIDVFQMIRPPEGDLSYANDYRDMVALKALAYEFDIAIIALHHLRKKTDAHVHNLHSGTTGLSGAADTSIIMEKVEGTNEALLHCTGRDISERCIRIALSEDLVWEFVREESAEQPSRTQDIVKAIAAFVAHHGFFEGQPSELATALSVDSGDTFYSRSVGRAVNNRQDELLRLGVKASKRHSNGKKLVTLQKAEPTQSVDGADKFASAQDTRNIGSVAPAITRPS